MKLIKISAMWCPGCLSMHKVWDKIRLEFPMLEIEEYDYDMDEEIVETFNVGNILPVTILMDNNQEVDRLIGEKSFEEIKEFIERK